MAFVAAFLAGAINAVAGGGTLLTFPVLIWLGLDSVTANATSTVAVCLGTVASAWGFRRELQEAETRYLVMIVPSLAGGLAGAMLLRRTPSATFDRLVPLLILFATLLFLVQEPLQRITGKPVHREPSLRWFVGGMFFQLAVGVYGGYFGAGIGMLMLAALSILGLRNIHQALALKVVFAASLNGIASLYFIWARMVYWPYVLLMAVAAMLGGWLGAGVARGLGRVAVRRIVIGVGFAMAVSLALKSW